jgi:colanic acid biosynthesis glycosyl transferase WcaI
MAFDIIKIQDRHLDQIADVHMKAFPTFFLTFLGPGFLKEFYRSFIYDQAGIGFVAIDSVKQTVLGAVVGPFEPAGYFKRLLKKRWYAFCLASIAAVLKKPTIIKRLFRAVFYRGEAPSGLSRALLSSIAVSPQAQGQGVGQALMKKWAAEVEHRGGTGCFLTTDAENNESVNRFYQKLGWKIESTYPTPEGRTMNRYILDFVKKSKEHNNG